MIDYNAQVLTIMPHFKRNSTLNRRCTFNTDGGHFQFSSSETSLTRHPVTRHPVTRQSVLLDTVNSSCL